MLPYILLALGLISTGQVSGEVPPTIIQVPVFTSGHLVSPNYPNQYRPLLHNAYILTAPLSYKIRLSFEDLDLDEMDMCQGDSIAVLEEDGAGQPPHGVFCGSHKPRDIISRTNRLIVAFKSDFLDAGRGFKISYAPVPALSTLCPWPQFECKNRNCIPQGTQCNGNDDCGDGTDEENCRDKPVQKNYRCGTSVIQPDLRSATGDRIVYGKETVPNSWPWQVSLQAKVMEPSGHMCGATLISDTWVLTAAHCFSGLRDKSQWRVHFGKHNKYVKEQTEQVRYIKKLAIFDDLNEDIFKQNGQFDMGNDMALILLNAPVKFTDHVIPACLPPVNYDIPVGSICYSTGWGMTRGTGKSEVLKQAITPIHAAKDCNTPQQPFNGTNQLCTGYLEGGEGVCHGDSGGPLVCQLPNKEWTLMGATSYGTETNFEYGMCGLEDVLAVFSRVAAKRPWIDRMMSKYR